VQVQVLCEKSSFSLTGVFIWLSTSVAIAANWSKLDRNFAFAQIEVIALPNVPLSN
jgi:hypothetical protein